MPTGPAIRRVMTPGFEHESTVSHDGGKRGTVANSIAILSRGRGPIHPVRGLSGMRGLDHRHDAGLQGLRQVGPCIDHGGQVGVILGGGCYYANAGRATGRGADPGRVGKGREGSGWDMMTALDGLAASCGE